MNTREPWDEVDALLTEVLTPYREVPVPRRTWKRLLRHLFWGKSLLWRWRLGGMGWGTPSLVSPYAPQPFVDGSSRWAAPPIVGAMAPSPQLLQLTS